MKKLLIISTIFLLPFTTLLSAVPVKSSNSFEILRKEVIQLFSKTNLKFPEIPNQAVTVGFLVNAKNELIITDVNGQCDAACEYVKSVLNFKKVKYCQAKQLTRYVITIQLVKDRSWP